MPLKAKEPFRFFTRLSLTAATGNKAKDLKSLVEHLKVASEAVIYQHTHRFLQQHQFLAPEPPNDFAYWVTNILQDEKLGERLEAIDTVRFSSLSDLRQAVIEVLEKGLTQNGSSREVPEGKEFHFMRSIRFSIPTPYQALDLAQFADCLKKVSISSLYLHIFEAKLRPPLGVNDFSYWFENELQELDLAQKVANLDPYTHTLEGLRSKIVTLIEKRLSEINYATP
ncbi:MAG: hypothetical protein HY401_03910 [Elusimicrobia bacterium]|nr:hypothetical protein [Elusimicrobiota bacterium]